MIIPSTIIHATGKLISPALDRLISDRAKLFKIKRLKDAPFSEVVGQLTGYEFIYTDANCGGYCSPWAKVIALNPGDWQQGEVRKTKIGRLPISIGTWQKATILHEVAHALQAESELFEKDPWLMTYKLKLEHQAESIAYKLFNACYGPLGHEYFTAYFDREGIEFLKDWYQGRAEDDLNLNQLNSDIGGSLDDQVNLLNQ